MGQHLAACFYRVWNIAPIRCTARSRITSGSPVWWCGYKVPNTHTHTRVVTYAHITLCLSVPTTFAAGCVLAASLYRVSQQTVLQSFLAFATAVSGVMRLWCSWFRCTGWPGALCSGARYTHTHIYIYIYIYTHTHTHTHTHIYIYIYVGYMCVYRETEQTLSCCSSVFVVRTGWKKIGFKFLPVLKDLSCLQRPC